MVIDGWEEAEVGRCYNRMLEHARRENIKFYSQTLGSYFYVHVVLSLRYATLCNRCLIIAFRWYDSTDCHQTPLSF